MAKPGPDQVGGILATAETTSAAELTLKSSRDEPPSKSESGWFLLGGTIQDSLLDGGSFAKISM